MDAPAAALRSCGVSAEALRLTSELGGVGLWEVDLRTGQAQWNDTLRRMLGVGPDHPASFASWLEFVPPEDRHLVEAHYPDHLVDRDLVCRVVTKDGMLRHLLIRGHELEGLDGPVIFGTAVDVTAVTAAQGHVLSTLEALNEAYVATDADLAITHVNARALELFERTTDQLVGEPLPSVLAADGAVLEAVRGTRHTGVRDQVEVRVEEFDTWFEIRTTPLAEQGVALFLREIGARKQLEREREELLAKEREAHRRAEEARAELERRETVDALTGVASRSAIERAALGLQGTGGHLVGIDLDGFGRINDLAGWDSGDDLLCEVAERVNEVIGVTGSLGRRTADTFLVVTPECDAQRVADLAEALAAAVRRPYELFGHEEHLTASIGIVPIRDEEEPAEALYGVDEVVQRCQELGGDRILWYEEHHRVELLERRRLAAELRQALARDQLVLRYQPIFAVGSGRYAGCEALLRWEHPERGLVLPESFLAAAARIGILGEIERWVVEAAVAQLGRWLRERDPERRRFVPPVLWINVAQSSVQRPGFADGVLNWLRDVEVDPSRLGIEFVPQHGLARGEAAGELSRLNGAGVRIGIDDIGGGSATISSLRGLPIDVVKVDERLMADVTSRRGRALLHAVVQLARALEADVVAEGVERPEQLAVARDAGCDLAAGYLLGRPVIAGELPEIVRDGLEVMLTSAPEGSPAKRPWWRIGARAQQEATQDGLVADAEVAADERDGPTGLGTRQAALALIDHHLQEGRRPVLLLIELDGFQASSVVMGPTGTIALLRAQARRLHVVQGARAFRFHDALFALVLPDTRRGPTSSQVDLIELATGPKGMTACVGIAHATANTTNAHELETHARGSLEAAQRRGNGSVHDGVATGSAITTATAAQVRALHTVLRDDYLRVHYQPILSLADGSLVGFQALARPQLDHGLSGPVEAFDVAASVGLVAELDAVCRSSVFADGPGFDLPPHAKLFVTVEPQSIGHKSLRSGRLINEIRAGGLTPERVVLQLREHSSVPGEVLRDEVNWLRDRGFDLALTDAGGASSGLAALTSGGFAHLKFATSLLADARKDDGAAAMIEALCAFSERSEIQVIATGIENPRLLTFARRLREHGGGRPRIHAVQGYHIGEPRPQPRFDGPIDPRLRRGGWGGEQSL